MSVTAKKFVGSVATIFNGSSTVAIPVIARLGKEGANIVVAYRGSGYVESKFRVCAGLGQMHHAHYHLKDEDSLYRAMENSDIVVNCIGKMSETKNFSYEEVHVEGARRLARIARECGVRKFIHLSAINAHPNRPPVVLKHPSKFLSSKYYGELAVREEFPEAIIFRPSDIIAERDNFINHFTKFQSSKWFEKMAIWDYYYEVEKQPVLLQDLVQGIAIAMEDDSLDGKTIQAVGPYRYDFYELIEYVRNMAGMSKYEDYEITNLRFDYMKRFMITFCQSFQKYPWMTWERVETDSISDHIDPKLPTLKDIGVELGAVEPWIERHAFFRPRHHRTEVAYASKIKFNLPRKLNVQT